MTVAMPAPDQSVLARRDRIVAGLRAIVPGEGVIAAEREMRPYESDGLTAYRQLPMVVVLPETKEQVSRVLAFCHAERIKVVPRGAGTSLSGGALPLEDGVLLGMAKFNRIREIDFANRVAVVGPGVTNLAVTQAVEQAGFYYAPDPSSQIACTIGGNVAENSGGVHCLKYGMTTNNLLGCELVLMTGEIVRIGGKHRTDGGRPWMGDSIGWYDGSTLVVETTNFPQATALHGAWKELKVTERFTRVAPHRVLYTFKVEDPSVWDRPWSGEYEFSPSKGRIFEYACHEGNYALSGILAGMRAGESAAEKAKAAGSNQTAEGPAAPALGKKQ